MTRKAKITISFEIELNPETYRDYTENEEGGVLMFAPDDYQSMLNYELEEGDIFGLAEYAAGSGELKIKGELI